jgi:hypothetical protein
MADMAFGYFIKTWKVNRIEKNQAMILYVEEMFWKR